MFAVYKRELRAYMHNVYGWLFMAIMLLFVGFMMFLDNLAEGYPNFEYALSDSQYALLILVPILCMRSMAEDKRNKTDMFYLSLPMQTSSVVLGKYFAMLTVYAVPCLLLCAYPLILSGFGPVNLLTAYVSILFFLLLGAALIAICQFLSSLTDNLVVAAVLGALTLAFLLFSILFANLLPGTAIASFIGFVVLALLLAAVAFFATHNLNVTAITAAVAVVPLSLVYILARDAFKGLFPAVLEFISPFTHFATFCQYGTLSIQSLILLLSYPTLFVFLTVQSADKKRWD